MSLEEIKSIFGNRIRVRVMGLLAREDQILMVDHSGLNAEDELWLLPGGGVEVGEHAACMGPHMGITKSVAAGARLRTR